MRWSLFTALLVSISAATALFAEKPPNVLFIAVDDLRPELGAYGSRAITPNIDRLTASGLRFDRAYCNQAVCGASRLALMTSLYPEYTDERSHHTRDWRDRHPDVVTLNQHFKENGYTTIGVGKIYHAWDGLDTDFYNWDKWVGVQGFKYVNPETLIKARAMAKANGKPFDRGPTTEIGTVENAAYLYYDGFRAGEGVRQLQTLSESEDPFFLAVGFSQPHLPFVAPKEFWDLYDRESFSMPENLGVPPGYPEYARNAKPGEMRSYADVPLGQDPKTFSDEMNKRLIHGYHASVSYMDWNVGRLLDALEASGKADNTIVILWGDHGWKLGEHYSWCKHTNFEIDTRVPLIIHHPHMRKAKGSSEALVEYVDIYPTLAELCGLEAPSHVQGKSFAQVLENPKKKHRKYAYSSYPRRPNDDIVGHSIRSERYRYTEWWDAETDELLEAIATDLTADPGETTNLLPDAKKLQSKLSKDLKAIVHNARKLPSQACH